MSLSCLKPFSGSLFFTEQSLESISSIHSPWGSRPCVIPHLSRLYLDTLGSTKTAHGSQNTAFCFLLFPLWLCHAPLSFLDLWLTHSPGTAPLLEGSPGPLSYCISVVPRAGPHHIHNMRELSVVMSTSLLYRAGYVTLSSPCLPGAAQWGFWYTVGDQDLCPEMNCCQLLPGWSLVSWTTQLWNPKVPPKCLLFPSCELCCQFRTYGLRTLVVPFSVLGWQVSTSVFENQILL